MGSAAKLLCTLCCCATLAAQGPTPLVELDLAADQNHRGPAAWTYVRAEILVNLVDWPTDLDPFDAIRLEISPDLEITARHIDSTAKGYLRATINFPGGTHIETSCDFAGLEGWHVLQADKLEPRIDMLLTLLDLRYRRNLMSLDLGALVGNLMAGQVCGDPLYSLLTEGAVECGNLQIGAFYEENHWRISGQSEGGLILPAAMVILAEWQSHPPGSKDYFTARPHDELDRWLLLASAGRDQVREEAARQLARYPGERAQRGLERLLHADGVVRHAAIVSLTRRGARGTLAKALAKADDRDSEEARLAKLALHRLDHPPLPSADMASQAASHGWLRPGVWTVLALSLLAIGSRLFSSRQS